MGSVAGTFDPFRILEVAHFGGATIPNLVAGTFDPFRILELWMSSRSALISICCRGLRSVQDTGITACVLAAVLCHGVAGEYDPIGSNLK